MQIYTIWRRFAYKPEYAYLEIDLVVPEKGTMAKDGVQHYQGYYARSYSESFLGFGHY